MLRYLFPEGSHFVYVNDGVGKKRHVHGCAILSENHSHYVLSVFATSPALFLQFKETYNVLLVLTSSLLQYKHKFHTRI